MNGKRKNIHKLTIIPASETNIATPSVNIASTLQPATSTSSVTSNVLKNPANEESISKKSNDIIASTPTSSITPQKLTDRIITFVFILFFVLF
jgi:hypothetical protein